MNVNSTATPLEPVSELELAALASAAAPGLHLRGIRGKLRDEEDGQWLTCVDSEGGAWIAWAPSHPWREKATRRFWSVNALLKEAATQRRIPFTAAEPIASVDRRGGGTTIVFAHPGGQQLLASDLSGPGLLPRSLGTGLAALHELPAADYARAAGQRASAQVTRSTLRNLVSQHARAIPARLRRRWMNAIDEDSLWRFEPVALHGSLDPSNVYAAAGGAVVGMKPFNAAAVGDPAHDIVWLMYHADDDFLQQFEASYSRARHQSDLHLLTRAQLLSELETLRWYARAVRAEDRAWRREGLAALQELDAEIGDQQLVASKPDVVEITFSAHDEPLMKLQAHDQGEPDSLPDEEQDQDQAATAARDTETEVIFAVTDLPTGPYSAESSSSVTTHTSSGETKTS